MSEGPFRPTIPDVPQSWFDFVVKLTILAGVCATMTTSIISCIQSQKNGTGIEAHGQQLGNIQRTVDDKAATIDKTAQGVKEIKAAMPDKP